MMHFGESYSIGYLPNLSYAYDDSTPCRDPDEKKVSYVIKSDISFHRIPRDWSLTHK
jgi:hypothetical protein